MENDGLGEVGMRKKGGGHCKNALVLPCSREWSGLGHRVGGSRLCLDPAWTVVIGCLVRVPGHYSFGGVYLFSDEETGSGSEERRRFPNAAQLNEALT